MLKSRASEFRKLHCEGEAKFIVKNLTPSIKLPYYWLVLAAQTEGIIGDELLAFINNEERVPPAPGGWQPKASVLNNALYLKGISGELHSPYLVHALTMLDLRQQANRAAQSVVSLGKINSMRIRVPQLTEQRRVVADQDAWQMEVDGLKLFQAETAAELDALLPAILDKAFKGKL